MEIKKRNCGGCTACCEGWLTGHAHERYFQPGRPCHFKAAAGCSVYDDRPPDPCKSYRCEWLINNDLPEWLRPKDSGVIVTRRKVNDIIYWDVSEMGKKIDSVVLNWLFAYHYITEQPMRVQVDGGWNSYGSEGFVKSVNGLRVRKYIPIAASNEQPV